MANNKVVAIVGMCGSGKSVAGDMFVEAGYNYLRFGQITLDIVKERGLEPNETNERPIREQLRKEHGMAAYAILNLPKIEKLLKKGNVIADGLYSWSEYKTLKEKFGEDLIILSINVPPKLRYDRLEARKLESTDKDIRNRPIVRADAKKRDYSEIENVEKGGPIAMADYTICNTGTLDEFKEELRELINKLGN